MLQTSNVVARCDKLATELSDSGSRRKSPTPPAFGASVAGYPVLSFAEIFGVRKSLCGVVCVILRLAVSVERRLVSYDRQTNGQTHDDS